MVSERAELEATSAPGKAKNNPNESYIVLYQLRMQTPQLHASSEFRVGNRFLLRKPVSSHAGKSRLASSQPCSCSKPPVLKVQPHRRQQHVFVAAAATASAPRPKTSNKKRKQVEPLLVVEDISKSHDGQRVLFDGLSFTVSRGDRLALVGPNGAGKSSLFNLLSGMLALQLSLCAGTGSIAW